MDAKTAAPSNDPKLSVPAAAGELAPSNFGDIFGQRRGSQEAQDPAVSDRIEKQLREALALKERGNELFGQGDKLEAMKQWHLASLHSAGINSFGGSHTSTEKQNQRAKAITIAVFNNLAGCYLSELKFEKVLYATGKVLALDEANVKAHYRLARALIAMNNTQKAASHLDKAMEFAPNGG